MSELGVLFVCTGNICRSPTAEGVFRHMVVEAGLQGRLTIDSAGTHDYHPNEPPDPRSQRAAARRGYDLSAVRGRVVTPRDFEVFDLLLAMDGDHLRRLQRLAGAEERRRRVELFLDYAEDVGHREVPDPYYGGGAGFERVLDLIEAGARGLLQHVRARLGT